MKIEDIIKIGDIHNKHITPMLKEELAGRHSYLDTKQSMREHLYCAATILEYDDELNEGDKSADFKKLSPSSQTELTKICKALDNLDCVYFRIVN